MRYVISDSKEILLWSSIDIFYRKLLLFCSEQMIGYKETFFFFDRLPWSRPWSWWDGNVWSDLYPGRCSISFFLRYNSAKWIKSVPSISALVFEEPISDPILKLSTLSTRYHEKYRSLIHNILCNVSWLRSYGFNNTKYDGVRQRNKSVFRRLLFYGSYNKASTA